MSRTLLDDRSTRPPRAREAWPTDERLRTLIAVALAACFGVQVFFGSLDESLTWDEPTFVASGYVNWVAGDYRLVPDHPPLMQKLQALPLLAVDVRMPPLDALRWGVDPNPRASYGRLFFFANGNDPIRLARLARAPVLALGMLLVLGVYGFGRELMRPDAALLACALAAFDPNLIAYAKLATEDLGCAAFMLAAVWSFWRWLERPGLGRALACGVATALALVSMYTGLLLVAIYPALLLAWWWQARPISQRLHRLRDAAVIALTALLLINFIYGFGFHLDEYVNGISKIYSDVVPDYDFYFWGRVSDRPFWYYAIASLAIKTPLSVWLLLGMASVAVARSPRLRPSALVFAVPLCMVLLVSCFDTTAPGVRRVLPAVPFMLLLAGFALDAGVGRLGRLVCWLALSASAASAIWIHPHQLSYLNPLFGGPDRGPYLLDDSNIDWGQDLPALARWQSEHAAGEPLALAYFGAADPAAYGVVAVPLTRDEIEHPGPGLKAISAHNLAYFRKLEAVAGMDSDWLSKYEPIAKAGYSIFIYRFPPGGQVPSSAPR